METIVIVGGNVAGGRAAEALRQEGFGGRIVLVGAEPERPYERPPLSKEYLSGERAEEQIYLRPPEYYAEQGIELRLGEPYAPVPFFWSDQYDLSLQYVGHAGGGDEVVLRGAVADGSWSAFYLRDGHLQAALGVNRSKDVSAGRRLIARRVPVEARQLADEGLNLRALAA
jgi:hypothetical protein